MRLYQVSPAPGQVADFVGQLEEFNRERLGQFDGDGQRDSRRDAAHNKHLQTLGNLARRVLGQPKRLANRASLILVDYPARRRLKIFARVSVSNDPDVIARLSPDVALAVYEFLAECECAEDRSNLDGDSAEAVLEQINDRAAELMSLLDGTAKTEGQP